MQAYVNGPVLADCEMLHSGVADNRTGIGAHETCPAGVVTGDPLRSIITQGIEQWSGSNAVSLVMGNARGTSGTPV